MSKQAVSVTLEHDNLTWLRARMRATRERSLSATLDQLVREARDQDGRGVGARRSVVGTITMAESDPDLALADAAIRALFAGSQDAVGTARPRGARKARARQAPKSARRA